MDQVEIISEREAGSGWSFTAQVLDAQGALRAHVMTLSWADYNLWSVDGSDAPAKVAEAVLTFMLSRMTAEQLPGKFDASLARRRFAEADAIIPTLIGR